MAWMVRVMISSAGKFCKGKVNSTATEYANWTVVDKFVSGSDVVSTVWTVSPNAIQQVRPKMA